MSAALLLGACSLITTYEGLEGATPCIPAKAPARPTAASDGPPLGPLVTAVSSLVLVGPPNGPAPAAGLDLDDQCTCPGPASCSTNAESTTCDKDGGIDNGLRDIFARLRDNGFPLADDLLQGGLTSGLFGILFRISGYSGKPEDPQVIVEMLNAVAANEGTGGRPTFEGTDRWTIDATSFVNKQTVAVTLDAYVTRGVLVAHFERLVPKFRISRSPSTTLLLDLELADVTLVGELAAVGADGATLKNAQLSGRSPIASWLLQVQRAGQCASSDAFLTFRKQLCELRDLAVRASMDNANAPCGAISLAVGFESVAATTAAERAPVESASACDGTLDAGIGCP